MAPCPFENLGRTLMSVEHDAFANTHHPKFCIQFGWWFVVVCLAYRLATANHRKPPPKYHIYAGFGTMGIRDFKHHAPQTRLACFEVLWRSQSSCSRSFFCILWHVTGCECVWKIEPFVWSQGGATSHIIANYIAKMAAAVKTNEKTNWTKTLFNFEIDYCFSTAHEYPSSQILVVICAILWWFAVVCGDLS